MFDDDDLTAKMIDLYQHERLTLREIGERLQVSKQAVHYRLRTVGLQLRPKKEARQLDRKTVIRMYRDEKLPAYKIAKKLRASYKTVVNVLELYGIERRSQSSAIRRFPELDNLKVGESVEVPKGQIKNPHINYYCAASVRGIRLSVKNCESRLATDHAKGISRTLKS